MITGATGFVGSHLARRLVNDGWTVHAIVRSSSKRDLIYDIQSAIYFHVYDGSIESMHNIFYSAQPEIMFHLASLFLSQHEGQDISNMIQSNVTMGTHLLEAAVTSNCFHFINTGTSWQHYKNETYNPVNLYAATKQAFEDILKYFVEAHGVSAITLKLFDTYGPDDPRPKIMNLLKRASETGEALDMSPGYQKIDLVHIDDVVEAFVLSAQRLINLNGGSINEVYGVASGRPLTLKDLVKKIEASTNKKINVNFGKKKYRNREIMEPWNSFKTIEGWKPFHRLVD